MLDAARHRPTACNGGGPPIPTPGPSSPGASGENPQLNRVSLPADRLPVGRADASHGIGHALDALQTPSSSPGPVSCARWGHDNSGARGGDKVGRSKDAGCVLRCVLRCVLGCVRACPNARFKPDLRLFFGQGWCPAAGISFRLSNSPPISYYGCGEVSGNQWRPLVPRSPFWLHGLPMGDEPRGHT